MYVYIYIYIYWVLPKSIDHPRPSSGPCLVPHCPAADRRTHAPWRNVTRKPMEKSGIFPKNPRCRSIKATNTHVKYGFKTYFIVSTGLCLQSINMYIYIYIYLFIYGLIGSCSYSLHLSRHRELIGGGQQKKGEEVDVAPRFFSGYSAVIKRVIFAFKPWEIIDFYGGSKWAKTWN